MEPDEIVDFLDKITSTKLKRPFTAAKIEIEHDLLLTLEDARQIEAVAGYSTVFLNDCLEIMVENSTNAAESNGDSILQACSCLIVELASRKDIAKISERDIALILSVVTATLNFESKLATPQVKSFDACFNLLSLFLQRFSKQIQSCVASLINSLTVMLRFVLFAPLTESDQILCGQKFSRIIELLLPHGEVYKKHILCLIVQFVTGLKEDMGGGLKKSLLPGIYCLLEIIQQHEVMQLNSMLDGMGRALLGTIYEGYKKKHLYKGQ